jgi:hypothetical protein
VSPVAGWRVRDQATGAVSEVTLSPRKRRGRKPKAKTLHVRLVREMPRRAPRGSVRFVLDGRVTAVHANRPAGETFAEKVERHHALLKKRRHPITAENMPSTGQAALWFGDVIQCVPRTGQHVARQVARLCGEDSQVIVPLRSVADAVGQRDRAGRLVAYTERGVKTLIEAGWLKTETAGSGPGSVTTYLLMPGDRGTEWFPVDDDEWNDLRD